MDSSISGYFFVGLVSVAVVLTGLIFLPFLSPLVLAAALSIIFTSLHRKILKTFFRDREDSSWGALVSLITIILIVFVPVTLVAIRVYGELQNTYTFLLDEGGRAQVVNTLNSAAQSFSSLFGIYPAYTFDSLNVVVVLQQFAQWILTHINMVFAEITRIGISLFVMFLALFYFLRDGRSLKRQLISLSPLPDTDDQHIFGKLEQAVRSIFAGSLVVGIMEGLQTGISFALFRVPSPAVWGALAIVASLIPGIGMPVILGSGVLLLYFMGMQGQAIGLLIWGIIAIAVIDNFLGPMFMHRGIKIHQFLILLSVLGGIVFFGPIGFVLGPLVLAFLFSLLEIHKGTKTGNSGV